MKKKNYSKPTVELMKVESKSTLLAESFVPLNPQEELTEKGGTKFQF